MNRIEMVQEYVDHFLNANKDETMHKCGYIHLYCVSQACAMLALRRGVDVELAVTAGLLHDVCTYKLNDSVNHAHKGAVLAREILKDLGRYSGGSVVGTSDKAVSGFSWKTEYQSPFSQDEIEQICQAIYNHSSKGQVDAPLDEVLKDADVLQHCLFDPTDRIPKKERERYEQLKKELGLQDPR